MNLADCIALAEFGHEYLPLKPSNRYDKSGAPYITHPKRVLASVQAQGARPFVQMGAILHDVTEDTKITAEMMLSFGVPEAAVEIVRLCDRNYSRTLYLNSHTIPDTIRAKPRERTKEEIDLFYYEQIRKNPGAVQVKLADIGDNLQPWRLSYLSEETQARLRAKYAKALELLA